MSDKPTLMVIIASIRPTRQGDRWGQWFTDIARRQGDYEVEVVDLAELALPFMDEPHHPRLGNYTKDHTKKWAAMVDSADAYVFVTPEYNYGYSGVLKNALDYLVREWADKPAGIVSYGGVSGGLRAAHQLRQVFGALGLVVPATTVAIPMSQQYLDADGGVDAPDGLADSATAMLTEMHRLGALLRPTGR